MVLSVMRMTPKWIHKAKKILIQTDDADIAASEKTKGDYAGTGPKDRMSA